jgi:hypothetical protein
LTPTKIIDINFEGRSAPFDFFFEEKIENEKILDVRNVDYGGGLPPVE